MCAVLTLGLVVGAAPAASAQATTPATFPPNDTPSVGVTPTETNPDDPNSGQWFVFDVEPGGIASTRARIGNPADVPQTVKLYLADLVFGDDGTPTVVDDKKVDVGAWGAFDTDDITIQPKQFVEVGFSIRVPADADPGDHVGAVVVESAPQGGAIKIVKRVATRLYVTVPGDATKSFSITEVTKRLDSSFFARELDVIATLRNTGRVRLETDVRVNGTAAAGSEVLLAQSVEKYTATVKVPWYGGPVKAKVRAVTDGGSKQVSVSLFVIPWHLTSLVPVAAVLWLAVRVALRWRRRKIRGLREDLRRLEKLVIERTAPEAAPAPLVSETTATADNDGREAERVRALRAGIKRAQRNGSQESLEALETALEQAEGARRDELAAAEEPHEVREREQSTEPETREKLADNRALDGFAAALADYVSHGND